MLQPAPSARTVAGAGPATTIAPAARSVSAASRIALPVEGSAVAGAPIASATPSTTLTHARSAAAAGDNETGEVDSVDLEPTAFGEGSRRDSLGSVRKDTRNNVVEALPLLYASLDATSLTIRELEKRLREGYY